MSKESPKLWSQYPRLDPGQKSGIFELTLWLVTALRQPCNQTPDLIRRGVNLWKILTTLIRVFFKLGVSRLKFWAQGMDKNTAIDAIERRLCSYKFHLS